MLPAIRRFDSIRFIRREGIPSYFSFLFCSLVVHRRQVCTSARPIDIASWNFSSSLARYVDLSDPHHRPSNTREAARQASSTTTVATTTITAAITSAPYTLSIQNEVYNTTTCCCCCRLGLLHSHWQQCCFSTFCHSSST
jgi:hypothetical protein